MKREFLKAGAVAGWTLLCVWLVGDATKKPEPRSALVHVSAGASSLPLTLTGATTGIGDVTLGRPPRGIIPISGTVATSFIPPGMVSAHGHSLVGVESCPSPVIGRGPWVVIDHLSDGRALYAEEKTTARCIWSLSNP